MRPKPAIDGSKVVETQGREVASFECKTSSESAAMTAIPGAIAVFAALASNLEEPGLVFVLLVLVGLLPVLVSLGVSWVPRTKSTCTIVDNGIVLKPIGQRSKARFLPWRGLARFSAKPGGLKGGRIYLYPKGPVGILRRVVIEPMQMPDYQLLYNHVSSRIGLF